MKNVSRYRALGSLCRQQAAYNPNRSWEMLARAEHWEYLADREMALHFQECNLEITNVRPVLELAA